jgi:phage virion morphogenesis protein
MPEPIVSLTYNDKAIQEQFRKLVKKTSDTTPAMNSVGQYLLLSTDQNFEKEVDSDGIPWKRNTPYTRRLKKAKGYIDKILQASGRGRASINYAATKDRVVVGTNVDYMRKHQLGLEGLPVRKFLGISKEDEVEIGIILDEYLRED